MFIDKNLNLRYNYTTKQINSPALERRREALLHQGPHEELVAQIRQLVCVTVQLPCLSLLGHQPLVHSGASGHEQHDCFHGLNKYNCKKYGVIK